jgi:alanine-glyoxylate transaminase/serine-glyoxylate transaminase/serine-pyruvate transaminase
LWQVAHRDQILTAIQDSQRNLAVQGELIGEGIQGNLYKIKGQIFYVFDIYDIDSCRYLTPTERRDFCELYELLHVPVLVDEWKLDAVYSATQKCLSCTPGLSPVTFNQRTINHVKARTGRIQSWFMDMNLLLGYWGEGARTYHHTAPTNSLFALHEALVLLQEEGLQQSWDRHASNHHALLTGLTDMGIGFLVAEQDRLPQMNAVYCPAGIDEAQVRRRLLNEHSLEIGAGLGPLAGKIWRIGIMGYSARPENITKCLESLASVIR